jgi:tripartite-type tricarboxylate transporter receptor subunit TctC
MRKALFPAAVAALGMLLVAWFADGASSQTAKTIRIIVPFAPGGAASVLARLVADQIGQARGPTTLVENRPGAGTAIGTEAVARAAPDGNTLLINNTALVINSNLRKQNYDPVTSFEAICKLVSVPLAIVVNSASPYHTLTDLLNAARAKPGELTLASITATSAHVASEMLKRRADVDMTFVPYAGSTPAVNALLGGHVTALLDNLATVSEHFKAGKLRALAVTSSARIETLPDLPTVAEAGYKDFEVESWFGLFAPAKTPKGTVSQLASWFAAALQVPEVKAKLVPLGLFPFGTCAADFGAFVRKQNDDYGRIIREANIKEE